MCGFTGIINKDGTMVDPGILKSMADQISHRGPDDEGSFIYGNIGFYHKRLSIIDIKTGHQPMTFNGITIVYNGEIYNYIELRNDLIQKGYKFETQSDTEVIIRMYQEYSTDCIAFFNGMFAFIIFDEKQNKLIIARDHFGIKPLYWYQDEKIILFGSEIKALLAHQAVNAIPNYKSIQEYLTFQFVLSEETMFENIYKICPGHFSVLDLSRMDFSRFCYWQPNFKLDPYHTEEYFIVELRKIIEDTIKIQLRSDVPLGTYLSGGTDSSLVTMLASQYYDKPLKTFTGAFREGKEFDETEYAREVCQACNAEMSVIYPTEQEFIDLMPLLIWHLDEPVAGPGIFPQYIVSRLAKEKVTVVLGGQGGDEIFGGYTRYIIAYLEQALKGAIFESNEEGEHIVSLRSILPNLPVLRNYMPLMKNFLKSEPFESMDRRYFNLINRMDNSTRFFTKDFLSIYDTDMIFARFQSLFNSSDTLSYYNKMTHFDLCGSLPAMLQVEDRVSMAVSIESRVPLLDRRIVDLVSVMPAGMKFKGGELKYLLKRTVKDIIPPKILNRKDKMGFPVPLHIWAKNKTNTFIKDVLCSKQCRERGIFNTDNISELVESERPFGRALWGLLSLELWFQQFIDG
jgi:asparagine synthase (glutamine-hydrolysing)